MTVPGLKALLDVLGNHQVSAACRRVVEDIFARYMLGDKSMLVQINLNDKVHRIPSFSYNFQPPTARAPEPGASSVSASRESSTQYDFTSTDDHDNMADLQLRERYQLPRNTHKSMRNI
jgi:hypothetical protein